MIGLEPISIVPKTIILAFKLHHPFKNLIKIIKEYDGIRTHDISKIF